MREYVGAKPVCEMKVTVGIFCANDRPRSSERGLSKSVEVRTRKMVNYAWIE